MVAIRPTYAAREIVSHGRSDVSRRALRTAALCSLKPRESHHSAVPARRERRGRQRRASVHGTSTHESSVIVHGADSSEASGICLEAEVPSPPQFGCILGILGFIYAMYIGPTFKIARHFVKKTRIGLPCCIMFSRCCWFVLPL